MSLGGNSPERRTTHDGYAGRREGTSCSDGRIQRTAEQLGDAVSTFAGKNMQRELKLQMHGLLSGKKAGFALICI